MIDRLDVRASMGDPQAAVRGKPRRPQLAEDVGRERVRQSAGVDAVAEFEQIERVAREGQQAIREGRASGATALRKVEERAQDAARWLRG